MNALTDLLPGLDLVEDPDVLQTLGHDEAAWAPAGAALAVPSKCEGDGPTGAG